MTRILAILLFLAACFQAEASSYPFTFAWTPRGVIGADMLGSHSASSATNPRGWFTLPAKDYISPAGMAEFRTTLLARADTEIRFLTNIHAQGVIFWDIGGDETHAVYYGDPRALPLLAPEMDACADEFFAKYRAAGLAVGVTIRPNWFQWGTTLTASPTNGEYFIKTDADFGLKEYACTNAGTWTQMNISGQQKIPDFYTNMLAKIAYAKARWGCTLFYLDSYGVHTDFAGYETYKDTALSNLARAYPDSLFCPELTTLGYADQEPYFASSAPYQNAQGIGYDVLASTRATYPRACALVRTTSDYCDYASLSNSFYRNNLLLVNTWQASAALTVVSNVVHDVTAYCATNWYYQRVGSLIGVGP